MNKTGDEEKEGNEGKPNESRSLRKLLLNTTHFQQRINLSYQAYRPSRKPLRTLRLSTTHLQHPPPSHQT